MAVSYTHLDVYKRQSHSASARLLPMNASAMGCAPMPDSETEVLKTSISVSYTPLDVYKRQEEHTASGGVTPKVFSSQAFCCLKIACMLASLTL